jgi:hypothetical protein
VSRLSRERPRSRALTASARKLTGAANSDTNYQRRVQQPWQLRSFSYYDTIGEISFTSNFLSRQISRVRFYPARRLEDGTTEPIDSGPPVEILGQIQDPGGGTTQVQYDYGTLMFLTGEGVLFGYDEGTRWKFLWKDEVRQIPGSDLWERVNWERSPTGEVGTAYRLWAPHPRWSDLATAPMQACQEICELILLLTMQTRATTVSRMTNGILWLPQEASFGPLTEGLDEDPEQNPFIADLMEHMQNQIENPGSAAAAMPFVGEMPSELIGTADWMKTHDPATDYMELEQLKEQIRRLALSLDMSPEDLLGYGDSNHWSARQVQLDRWRMFGYNKAELWAQSLSDAYLRPKLEEEEYPNWQDVVIAFDDSQVVISPDRTEDALKANKQGLINAAAARTALGWSDKDAMDDEEYAEWFALQLRQVPESMSDVMVPERGPMPSSNGNGNGNAADGPPEPGVNTGVSRQESRTASGVIFGAAELVLHRCRELAGVRVRHKCPDCADGQPLSIVASALGPEGAPDAVALVRGGADGFRDYLTEKGMGDEQAGALCQQLEVFAARTLYEPSCPSLPSGFVASVNKALEVSHEFARSA